MIALISLISQLFCDIWEYGLDLFRVQSGPKR